LAALAEAAARFKEKVQHAKRDLGAIDFEWYPYDTLTALSHLDRLLTGENRFLLGGNKLRIVDVGCGDGELSFFLESLGHEVVAVDHRLYNHNELRGVLALKAALGSSIELHEIDVDRQFSLPHDAYDLALFLGVLYHLRNPFYALEELAKRASRCLLSTRIARRFPNGKAMPANVAMAYLLDDRELNDDDTNYFIFSESGLRVMLRRTHWEVCDSIAMGNTRDSRPVRADRDERVFCFLKSCYGRMANVELLEGWHESEASGWRWTRQEFSARARWNGAPRPRAVTVQLFLAEGLIQRVNPLCLSLSVNGRQLAPEVYRNAGKQKLVRTLGGDPGNEFELRFRLNGALPPDDSDARERGVIVESIRLE